MGFLYFSFDWNLEGTTAAVHQVLFCFARSLAWRRSGRASWKLLKAQLVLDSALFLLLPTTPIYLSWWVSASAHIRARWVISIARSAHSGTGESWRYFGGVVSTYTYYTIEERDDSFTVFVKIQGTRDPWSLTYARFFSSCPALYEPRDRVCTMFFFGLGREGLDADLDVIRDS